jgi:hypothetical protein
MRVSKSREPVATDDRSVFDSADAIALVFISYTHTTPQFSTCICILCLRTSRSSGACRLLWPTQTQAPSSSTRGPGGPQTHWRTQPLMMQRAAVSLCRIAKSRGCQHTYRASDFPIRSRRLRTAAHLPARQRGGTSINRRTSVAIQERWLLACARRQGHHRPRLGLSRLGSHLAAGALPAQWLRVGDARRTLVRLCQRWSVTLWRRTPCLTPCP